MKLKNAKTQELNKRGHTAAFLISLCLLIGIGLAGAAAQSRAQKRITSVWTATGAEGSRVTVASDVQLNDCEGYTRGDRFYVKIPMADLPSTTGSLLGRGFDDVQIQRSGDGIILSFHLQPGTTARIDQKLNRIEIVFSIPTRSLSASSRTDLNEVANRTRARTIRDNVGPTPARNAREDAAVFRSSDRRAAVRSPGTPRVARSASSKPAGESRRNSPKGSTSGSSRQKPSGGKNRASSSGNAGSASSSKQPKQPSPKEAPSPGVSSGSKESSAKSPGPSASPLPSVSPVSSPSPTTSASSSSAAASPSGTPASAATPVSQQTTSSASPTPVSAGKSDWSSRFHWYKTWVQLNPLPVVIAGVIFLALLLLLFVRGGRKRRSTVAMYKRENRAGTKTTSASSVRPTPEPVMTPPASAVAGQARAEAPSEKSMNSRAAKRAAGEDPDREVFEL